MLKLIFDKDVNFKKKKFNVPKVETLRMARYIQILCLSTMNLINQRNVSHIKLSKYCDIDARLIKFKFKNQIFKFCGKIYSLWRQHHLNKSLFQNSALNNPQAFHIRSYNW